MHRRRIQSAIPATYSATDKGYFAGALAAEIEFGSIAAELMDIGGEVLRSVSLLR